MRWSAITSAAFAVAFVASCFAIHVFRATLRFSVNSCSSWDSCTRISAINARSSPEFCSDSAAFFSRSAFLLVIISSIFTVAWK